ncbi:MAG: hypothetical protein MRY74_07440 [Neomegalonema sp.]|nr:hypothetical protein [Neomegalonema sp.]
MLRTLSLLAPALAPSWRFFDEIAPSPRVEYTLLPTGDAAPTQWREFRPRPDRLSLRAMIRRLFWNPHWNEGLFLVSCSERLIDGKVDFSRREIMDRVVAEVRSIANPPEHLPYVRFRLTFLYRQNQTVEKHVLYVSDAENWREGAAQ